MDYDDNDFQSQSFQIAGEENTNFPLGLRSYSLPKFDIDDNLQVNLRFDSLVESEVLLGIQTQEQNQWIEDFSGGSSGIEFNSSAAESCSISRRNNVWSEATSSESVEMLLKSVGQDEMIMGQTILEESEPCDGLGNMANQMELKSSQDGYDPSKIGDVVDVKLTLPIDKSPENLSDLCTDAADQLPRIEATPKIDNVEISGTGSLVDLGQSSVSGQCSLAITEGNLFNDGRCYDANKKEEGLLDRSGGSNTLDYSNALVSNQLDSSHTSVQTFATNAGELSNQNVTLQVEGLQQDTTYNVGEHQARSEEAQMDDQICKNKAVETSDNNLLNSSGLALKVESTIPMTEVSSEVVFPDSSISVNKWQGIGSCTDAESIDQFVGSTQEASRFMVGRDNNSEALSVDLSSGGILSSPVQTMDPLPLIIQGKGNTKSSEKQGDLLEYDGQEYPFKQMKHGHSDIESTEKLRDLSHDDGQEYPFKQMAKGHGDIESTEKLRDLSHDDGQEYPFKQMAKGHSDIESTETLKDLSQVDGHQLVRGISVSNTKSLTMDDHLFVKGQVDTINQVVSSSFVVDVCSSTSVIHVSKATENTEDGDKSDDVLGVRGVDIRREAPISSSMQICDKNLLGVESSSAHISPLDVSFLDKENATLPNDPGSEGSEADGSLTVRKEVSSSSLGPSATSAAVMFDQTPSDQVLADESVSTDVIQDVCILTFNCKSDGAHPLPSSSNVAISEVIEYDEDAKSPLLGEDLACLDKKEETITELSAEPSSLVMKINPQMKNESVAVPELEQGAVCGNAREMLSETNSQSTSPFEAATAACQTEPHISIANNADNEGSKEECTVVSDSIMQESEGAEVVGVSSVEDQGAFLKTTGSLGETPLETVLSPLHDSSRDDGLTNLDCKVGAGNSKPGESLLADKGDPVNACKDPCTPVTALRDDSKSHSLEAASSYPNSSEPNCGSPTVISCNELPQSEIENQVVARGSLDQNAPASNDIDLVGNNIKTTAHNHKESHASQGDRNFTFEVISVADLAQRRADNEWKPFPSIQPYESPKIAQGSPPTTSSLHQNFHGSLLKSAQGSPPTTSSLHQNFHGSLLKSGGKHAPKTAKSNIGEKKTPLSGKTSRKTSNKGRPLKDELSKSEKEHQDGGMGCLDKNTPVSDHDPKENNVTGGDISFTFEVSSLAHLSGKETGHGLKPFACIQPYGFPQTVGASPSASGLSQIDPKILQEISRGSPRSSGVKNVRRNSKSNTEDRTKPVSGKAVDRETSKEGKHLKETTPTKFPKERGINSPSLSPSSIGVMSRGFLQTEERRLFGYIEGSDTKPCVVPAVQTSKLPDLNTSASSSAFFHQPFSDFQQLQLRAQIFVYGSLIQGTAPEEACMVSAFGESDGGRNVWESVWRVTVERIQNQKSPLINPETPLHLHSGVRVPGQASKQIYQQSEMFSTPGRAGSKGGPSSAIVNPMNPLSSPVWTISTPRDGFHSSAMMRGPLMDSHQTLLPLHPYQSPHLRHFIGNTTPWQSQVPSPATWVVTTPQTTSLDTNVHYAAMPVSEAIHTTTVRESAVSHTSGMQPAPLSPVILNGGPISIPAGTPVSVDTIRTSVLPVKHVSSEGKPRKRKKSSNSVEPGEISSSAQPQAVAEPASSSFPLATPVAITTPASSMSKVTHGSFVLPTSPVSSTHHQILGGQDTDERVSLSEETCSKIEQAKQHAEDAAKHAASAVKHSENLWSQLALQKNSGLGLDVEAKLASSAVAIAAAAAVAKAASAVAKVAFDAALQAKLMADEALVTIKSGNPTSEASLHDGVRNLGNVTPASILKGKDRTNTSVSILVAAKETAKKRVEAASAATKRAENLDAVLRAAEMAAEAVSQAGTIVAMGDPIPLTLNELVAAGAEGYWKVQNIASEQHAKSKATNMDQSDIDSVEQGLDISAKQYSERQSKETKQTRDQDNVLPSKETSRQSADNSCLLNDSRWNSVTSSEKEVGEQNICQTSDTAKTIGVVPESQIGSANAYPSAQEDACEGRQPIRTVGGNSIEEGSTVEVLNYEGLRRVWFEAKVLSLKEGRAFVCYTELARDKGTDQQSKEWVPLEGEEGKAPRIRFPHPMSAVKYEGPGKRRREVRGDYTWSVGDRVDTWIHDGWWEAIIIEKPQETEMTVQFSVEGEKSLVRSWNLRPCVIWKDGQWMEWCSLKENNRSHEGDTPREKRPKLVGNGGEFDPTVEIIGKDLKPMHMGTEALGKPEASLPLALSAKEKIFTMGKSIREDDKSNTQRTKRTGLQKEGSRVNLGGPKPGQKKRKFMDVSKHYVANRGGKPSEGSDSLRFANFLIPQESASSRGWKNPPKVVSKGKQVAEPKPKGLKMGKPQSLGRNTFEKDSSSSSVLSASKEGTVKDRVSNDQASVSRGGNVSEKQKLVDPGSFHSTRKTAEAQPLLSSSDAPYSKKRPSSFVASNLQNKGKVTASGEMLARIDENDAVHHDNPGKSLPGAAEPRRSNRRIQPTSRLLEGLQSSLTISKIPQISHDRGGTRTQPRSATNRGGNHG